MMHRPNDHRSRSAKPLTIHGYAQSGDLLGFQKLLRDNPSLLNDTNPVVRSPFSSFFVFVFGSMCFFKFVGELGCDSCIVSINLEFEKFELWWVRQGMSFYYYCLFLVIWKCIQQGLCRCNLVKYREVISSPNDVLMRSKDRDGDGDGDGDSLFTIGLLVNEFSISVH